MKTERHDPVPFDVEASHARWMKRPGYAKAYAALADEFALLGELLRARQSAGLKQAKLPSAWASRSHPSRAWSRAPAVASMPRPLPRCAAMPMRWAATCT